MADLPVELRKYVTMLRGVVRVLALPNASEGHLQSLNSLVEAILGAIEPDPLIQARVQTLRINARALLAYRRYSFDHQEKGERTVASALAACENNLRHFVSALGAATLRTSVPAAPGAEMPATGRASTPTGAETRPRSLAA